MGLCIGYKVAYWAMMYWIMYISLEFLNAMFDEGHIMHTVQLTVQYVQ